MEPTAVIVWRVIIARATMLGACLLAIFLAGLVLVVAVVLLGPTGRFKRLEVAYDAACDACPEIMTRILGVALCSRARGERAMAWCRARAFDAPNPLGQCVYLTLCLGGHAMFVDGVEGRLLDAGDAGGWTAATGAAVAFATVTWLAACCRIPERSRGITWRDTRRCTRTMTSCITEKSVER